MEFLLGVFTCAVVQAASSDDADGRPAEAGTVARWHSVWNDTEPLDLSLRLAAFDGHTSYA
jgi:hypothetical protein